jgi:hypothetical protein
MNTIRFFRQISDKDSTDLQTISRFFAFSWFSLVFFVLRPKFTQLSVYKQANPSKLFISKNSLFLENSNPIASRKVFHGAIATLENFHAQNLALNLPNISDHFPIFFQPLSLPMRSG